MKKLYDDQDDSTIFVESTLTPKQEKQPETLGQEQQDHLNKMFAEIKHTATHVNTVKKTRFTRGKGDLTFNIDKSPLSPLRTAMVGQGTFEDRYLKQLNSFLHTDKNELNPDNLIPLLILVEMLNKGNNTIHVKTGKYKQLAGKITNCMNIFFEENEQILEAMFGMFKDIQTLPPKEKASQ